MTVTEIRPGYVKLAAPGGVMDTRNKTVYSQVICKIKDTKYFVEAEA